MKILILLIFLIISCTNKETEKIKENVNTNIVYIEKNQEEQKEVQEQKEIQEQQEVQEEKEIKKTDEEIEKAEKEKSKEKPKRKVVYLTFDDGPSSNTLRVIKILNDNNIKGTFFVIGKNQHLYKNIVESGHQIALHTYTHKYKEVYASVDSYFDDLYRLQKEIYEITGINSKVVRLPGGSSSSRVSDDIRYKILQRLNEEGYVYQDWNCDSSDSKKNIVDLETIKQSSYCPLRQVNLLMHDTEVKNSTVEALQYIIDKYKEQGYEFDVLTLDSPKFQHRKVGKK